MWTRLAFAGALLAVSATVALPAPERIVILRDAETADAWRLCEAGQQRAEALKYNYLGRNAGKSLFEKDEGPAYVFALTLAGAQTVSPAVESWNKPIIFYSVVPEDSAKDTTEALNKRTRAATANILTNPALKGKTVVMVWDARHIADPKLDAGHERETSVTLRNLFRMDILPGVPDSWPADNHDYFWILEFPEGSNVPSKFEMMKQDFGTSFPGVPANGWGEPSGLDAKSGCVSAP